MVAHAQSFRSNLVVDGFLHRAIERLPRLAGRGVSGATRPVGVGYDDKLSLGVDENALAEDAARGERAIGMGPSEVPIAAAGPADVGERGRGIGQPAVGHDALTVDACAVHDEQAEASKGARCGLDAAAADLLDGAVEKPGDRLLGAGRRPDLFREVGRQRLLSCLADEDADEVGFARAVVPERARACRAALRAARAASEFGSAPSSVHLTPEVILGNWRILTSS